MNPKINRVLERIHSSLSEEVIGVNEIPIEGPPSGEKAYSVRDELFDLMDDVVEGLASMHGMQAEAAFNYAAKVGDQMAEASLLPPFPDDEMSDKDIARWLVLATYRGFKSSVHEHYHMEAMK